MPEKGLVPQNIIAVIWDFDKTLSPRYMQAPLFEYFDIDEPEFWKEVNKLPEYYARAHITVHQESCYLGHLLTYVQAGRMPGLSNAMLRELGARITFYAGIPDIFERLQETVRHDDYRVGDFEIRLEHYVVSTGLKQLILGSEVAPYLKGVWASEFVETPAPPAYTWNDTPKPGAISQVATFLDNTTKTRAIFEINKGVGIEEGVTVNDSIPEADRRIPIANMIYVADGPSDIPCFSVVKKHGGLTFAVYDPDSEEHFAQAERLRESKRVDSYGPANYERGHQTDLWLSLKVKAIAQRIVNEYRSARQARVSPGPTHVGG